MTTFVLIHGAWHGAWTWDRLTPLLRRNGIDPVTPTLTGLGESADRASPDVDLSGHVEDVVQAIVREDLHDVVLVGHSYAGIVTTMVASRIPDRIAGLIYMDAFIPEEGTSLLDLLSPDDRAGILQATAKNDPDWMVPPAPPAGYGVWDKETADWLAPRLCPTPLACFAEKASFDLPTLSAMPRTCLVAANTDTPRFGAFADRLKAQGVTRIDVESGHDMMLTHPELTARSLAEAAAAIANA